MKIFRNRIIIIVAICSCVVLVIFVIYIQGINIKSGENNMKETIIETLNNNTDYFNDVTKFCESQSEVVYFSYRSGKIVAREGSKDINIESLGIERQIKIIVNDLNFSTVIEYDNCIEFIRQGSPIEKGIVFMKNNLKPKDGDFNNVVLIKDNWYYYEKYHD
jgi:hypothetical protein